MLNTIRSEEKLLTKIKKWGSQSEDIDLLLYTSYLQQKPTDSAIDLRILVFVNDLDKFTRNTHWLNYFGRSSGHLLNKETESHSLEVDYISGLKVKFIIAESCQDGASALHMPFLNRTSNKN